MITAKQNQKFSLPILFSSAGGVGGEEAWDASARKNGKEIFGFAPARSPHQSKLGAEAGGFEPPMPLRTCQFSRLVPSTTQPRFQLFHPTKISFKEQPF